MHQSKNTGYLTPYEVAYDKRPNYDMLVPFGRLAYASFTNINKNGKANYRKVSRVCVMIGYYLKPDGHPLSTTAIWEP